MSEVEGPAEVECVRAAIELVLAHPDAVAEILTRARPAPVRHDGWSGERMAAFLETLADTGLVTEGCRAAGMSRDSFYALRNRDPFFAAAVDAARSRARPAVADGLLERSITGTVEHYYRDGVLVGERRHYESWLGLAVLKRLDKQAEQDRVDKALSDRISNHWREAMETLREGGDTALLAGETDKADTPPPPADYFSECCWQVGTDAQRDSHRDHRLPDGTWMTTFPPPPGFDGYQNIPFEGFDWYERVCTPEEVELIETHAAAAEAEERAELIAFAEEQRDRFFAQLRSELGRDGVQPPLSTTGT